MNQTLFHVIDPWLRQSPVLPLEVLPESMRVLAVEIAKQPDQESALRYAYEALAKKYRGYRTLTFLRLDRFFITDMEILWKIRGFLHCHHMNYLFRTLLVASEKFTLEAIETRWTQIWLFSPHQYLAVTLKNGQVMEIDLWGKAYGVPFGSHAHGFQGGSFFARMEQ